MHQYLPFGAFRYYWYVWHERYVLYAAPKNPYLVCQLIQSVKKQERKNVDLRFLKTKVKQG